MAAADNKKKKVDAEATIAAAQKEIPDREKNVAEAKAVLADGGVTVNGEVELRRGAQLRAGDVVRLQETAAGWRFRYCR